MAKVDLANQIADSLNKKWKDQKVAFFLDVELAAGAANTSGPRLVDVRCTANCPQCYS